MRITEGQDMRRTMCNMPDILCIQDPEAWHGMKGRLFLFLQDGYKITSSFFAHQGAMRAAALTYTTILSLVPFLAIAFAVLKGFGVQNALEPMLLRFAGDSEETISKIISYVNNTNVKTMGAVGLVILVLTAISLLSSIEEAFNTIFGVEENRPLQRRFSDYLSVVIVGPVLLLAATSMNTSLQSQWLVKWLIDNTYLGGTILLLFRMVPFLFIWLAMTFTYIFLPNTKVQLRSAVLGGILAGTAWQIAQWGYFHFEVGMARYNAIYGTLAALPIFLIWVYTSWLIVLFGLEIVYAHQFRTIRALPGGTGGQSTTGREVLALSTLLLVCRRFSSNAPPAEPLQLSNELGITLIEMWELLETLRKLHFIVKVGGDDSGWLPAHDPSTITLAEVLTALRGEPPLADNFAAACGPAVELLCKESGQRDETLQGITLHDLLKIN